jgi:hypothetical protein
VVFTALFRVKDWTALRRLSDGTLIVYARAARARRYQFYRNTHDAAEALLIVEAASQEDLLPLRDLLLRCAPSAAACLAATQWVASADGQFWEPASCGAIG